MRSRSSFAVERVAGVDRLADVRCEPPLAIRHVGPGAGRGAGSGTGLGVLLVGSAAGPVGGDELVLDARIGHGASAAVGSAAATMVWPGPPSPATGATPASSSRTTVAVGAGARLRWWPEPTVVVAGARHRVATRVSLEAGAWLALVEELVLGRTGEPPGTAELAVRVEVLGRPVLHHVERVGPEVPGWESVATAGAARHLLVAVLVGPHADLDVDATGSGAGAGAPPPRVVVGDDRRAALARLAPSPEVTAAVGTAAMVVAVGIDRPAALAALAEVAPALSRAR